MISASFVLNLAPLLSLVIPCLSDASGDASLIIAHNCNVFGLIPRPDERSISACLISYVNYVALVKFPMCHSLLLSLDEELADLSLPLAFFPSP